MSGAMNCSCMTDSTDVAHVTIPRAEYEALRAAATHLLEQTEHLVPCGCTVCRIGAALRAAGILEGE